jgi:LmbE family N-acetylglucosaminyl deacetylase
VAPITDPAELGTIVGVWAHPDDEAYLSGGIMAAAVANGQRVVCITATRGELGVADESRWPAARLAGIRTAELDACLAALGVTEHHWLDLPDGGCAEVADDDGVALLADLIAGVRPDTILTFDDTGQTGHPDHMAVSRWATGAGRKVAPNARILHATKTAEWNAAFFEDVDPTAVMMVEGMRPPETDPADLALYVTLDERALARKMRALRCQASQIDPLIEQFGEPMMIQLNREEFFIDAP